MADAGAIRSYQVQAIPQKFSIVMVAESNADEKQTVDLGAIPSPRFQIVRG